MQFSEEQLAMLSEEERAALAEGDESAPDATGEAQEDAQEEPQAEDAQPAQEEAQEEPQTEDAQPAQEETQEEPQQTEDAPQPEAEEAGAQEEPKAAPQQHPSAPYAYALPAEFAERAKALQERQTELEDKLEGGEIDATQFIMQQRELAREQAKLDAMQFKAEMAAEMQQQAEQRAMAAESEAWARAMQELAGELGDGSPDYLNTAADGMALAQQARAIMAARGIADGAPVTGKLDILRDAHRLLLMARGVQPAAKEEARGAPADAKAKVMAARKVDLSAAPATLGATPGADSGSTDAFKNLDDLDGEKLEAALGRLARTDPAAYERWLAAA